MKAIIKRNDYFRISFQLTCHFLFLIVMYILFYNLYN